MIILARQKGYHCTIWKVISHRPMRACPECGEHKTMQYVGFAKNYSRGFSAKLYTCTNCDTWLDCIWSNKLDKFVTIPAMEGDDVKTLSNKPATAGRR